MECTHSAFAWLAAASIYCCGADPKNPDINTTRDWTGAATDTDVTVDVVMTCFKNGGERLTHFGPNHPPTFVGPTHPPP